MAAETATKSTKKNDPLADPTRKKLIDGIIDQNKEKTRCNHGGIE